MSATFVPRSSLEADAANDAFITSNSADNVVPSPVRRKGFNRNLILGALPRAKVGSSWGSRGRLKCRLQTVGDIRAETVPEKYPSRQPDVKQLRNTRAFDPSVGRRLAICVWFIRGKAGG